MTTASQERLLELTVLALFAAVSGDLLGMTLLTRVGVTGFFLGVAALLAVMTAALVVGLGRLSGPDMRDSVVTRP